MVISNTLPPDISEVDVLIAGGGAAGSIIAARLAQADASLSILLVERGADNSTVPTITHPALFLANLAPTSTSMLFYPGNPEEQLGGRSVVVPAGGTLGGGSATNLMMYSRAQRSDFDAWGVPGWSTEEMIPFVRKLETYTGPGNKETHGDSGPINITRGTHAATVKSTEDEFIAAAAELGYPEVDDIQSMEAINSVARAYRYIGSNGRREDVVTRYLLPLLSSGKYPNLHVLTETEVIRVLFDSDKRASGLETRPNPIFQDKAEPVRAITARKLVILTAGALGTPPILERSGVGSRDILDKAGVSVVVELPGVGKTYDDHQLLLAPYHSNLEPRQTLDDLIRGRVDVGALIASNDSILGWNAQDVTSKLRPSEEEVEALGPVFKAGWEQDFENVPDRPLSIITLISGLPTDPSLAPDAQYFATTAFCTYPRSSGHVHITGPSLGDALDFATGFFTDPFDIKACAWSYKKQREIVRRTSIYRGEVPSMHPQFSPSSPAAAAKRDGPLAKPVENLAYSEEDDAALDEWLRQTISTTWHSLGTCKMAPREQDGVVDGSLSVYGVHGLKLADLSIVPKNVGANTANTAYAIAEKAAELFKAELGLS
ncbi:hypothetical protein S40293_05239 [Stachybotrys chartarum IBT 40293]|nr:hypothetical protein S40293_05239 [Stachybotrys chartarum IBT 40293]